MGRWARGKEAFDGRAGDWAGCFALVSLWEGEGEEERVAADAVEEVDGPRVICA